MRTLLVAVLVLLIPISYGDQESELIKRVLEIQLEPDDFNGLMYKSPTITCGRDYGPITDMTLESSDRVGGSSSESPDIKEKQEIEAVYVGGRGILEMMIKDPDEVRALVLQQNTKSSNAKEKQVEDE